ncbi:MAG: DNA repair protein [Symploca sp. SIO2G7]|nr:DNA repair protein [Symploca sp. SIO2G7]
MDISVERMMVSKEQVLAILLMRFNLHPSKATLIAQTWFKQHPTETWETLKNLLSDNQVIVSEGGLRGAPQSITPESCTTKYRGTEYSRSPKLLQSMKYANLMAKGKKYRGVKY